MEVQQELQWIGYPSKDTVMGRDYDYALYKIYATFAECVPIVAYEDIHPLIERTRSGEQNLF
jgi:hypothetical protein